MVHDWLFLAKNCNTDGMPTKKEKAIAQMEFPESADVMAEAIKSLVAENMVKKNDVSESLIPSIVGGPISRRLWEQDDACAGRRVTKADRIAAEAGLPGSQRSLVGMFRRLPDNRIVPVKAAKLIDTFSY